MAWNFAESWDCYAAVADALTYWDTINNTAGSLVAGRFANSRAMTQSNTNFFVKSSGVNDAVHHFVVAFQQTSAISGTTLGLYFELFDGATGQCSVVFRSDGAILLTSGGPTGTALATYTGAFTVINTWYAFEIEVVISNTAGWMKVRKNGNTSEDFTSALNLNTRVSANNYANKLQVGSQASGTNVWDDLFWRSDASSVAWLGDIKCTTRMPASDASVQWSRAGPVTMGYQGATIANISSAQADYTAVISTVDGTVSQVQLPNLRLAYTGNLKCTVFANFNNAGTDQPGAIIGSATPLTNPPAGLNTFTFSSPFTVVRGTKYWIGFMADTALLGGWNKSSGAAQSNMIANTSYAAFPVATPVPAVFGSAVMSVLMIITPTLNFPLVAEAQQDAATSYVYDSTVGHEDYYGIASIASTPLTTHMITTRAYMQKSDAGTRTAAVQLKSGASVVASPTLVLTTSGWQWAWRSDTTDPATGAAWSAAAVNNVQVGPKCVA